MLVLSSSPPQNYIPTHPIAKPVGGGGTFKSMMHKKVFYRIASAFKTTPLVLALLLTFGLSYAYASWSEPTATPPGGNADAPINVGSAAQKKIGGLLLNTGGAINGLIVQYGNVGIGTVSPQSPAPNGKTSGNITVNDIYISSIGKWASQLGGGTAASPSQSPVLSATYTYTTNSVWYKPGNLKYIVVQVWGGGGGGSGSYSAYDVGSGGGGGGYAKKTLDAASLSSSYSVTVATGGAGGFSTSNSAQGNDGGNSSFGGLVTATGGGGGISNTSSTYAAGGTGGVGESGDVNVVGGNGVTGIFNSGTGVGGTGGAGAQGGAGGAGGTYSQNGGTGQLFGGGGGGSGYVDPWNQSVTYGGSGAPGKVLVQEYTAAP